MPLRAGASVGNKDMPIWAMRPVGVGNGSSYGMAALKRVCSRIVVNRRTETCMFEGVEVSLWIGYGQRLVGRGSSWTM